MLKLFEILIVDFAYKLWFYLTHLLNYLHFENIYYRGKSLAKTIIRNA